MDLPGGFCAADTGRRHQVHRKCLSVLQQRDKARGDGHANLSTSPSSASSASSSSSFSSSSSIVPLGDNKADVKGEVKAQVKGEVDTKDVFEGCAALSEKGGCPRCGTLIGCLVVFIEVLNRLVRGV